MTYVDGFLIPIPKASIDAYRKQARLGARVWTEHGAIDYRECLADELIVDDGHGNKVAPFATLVKLEDDETLVFAWILFRNKPHRNAVNKKVMKDPRILESMTKPMPFDMARLNYGGFKGIVEAPKSRAKAARKVARTTRSKTAKRKR